MRSAPGACRLGIGCRQNGGWRSGCVVRAARCASRSRCWRRRAGLFAAWGRTYLAAWMDDVHGTSPAQMMEARLLLEPGLAAAAAGCAMPADMAELDRWAALGDPCARSRCSGEGDGSASAFSVVQPARHLSAIMPGSASSRNFRHATNCGDGVRRAAPAGVVPGPRLVVSETVTKLSSVTCGYIYALWKLLRRPVSQRR
jgi:hypothetical protein